MTGNAKQTGLIVACFGNRGYIDNGTDPARNYLLKGKRLRAVCGDRVEWEAQPDDDTLLVTAVEERINSLDRVDTRGQAETIAANIEQLVVVVSPEPEPDWFIADRYLCAAEMLQAKAIIVWNKLDLESGTPAELRTYEALGYSVIMTSATENTGIGELLNKLANGVSMLVGQSGVGKSSLINCLIPEANAATGEVSAANREGKHTTTASVMHNLPDGGRMIDSPGVRDFAPAIRETTLVQTGFREISQLAPECRFNNCQHLREPNCAVKEALEKGRIQERRYESYKRLMNTVNALAERDYK